MAVNDPSFHSVPTFFPLLLLLLLSNISFPDLLVVVVLVLVSFFIFSFGVVGAHVCACLKVKLACLVLEHKESGGPLQQAVA